MSIQNYLNKIKDAVFGKDIREAIYASIKQCYDDAAVNHDNANMEVKFARGSHHTLNDRLTEHEKNQKEINEQLDTKANLNSVFSMANMGQDVKEAMTGSSVAVVGRNAILTDNIVNKQITPIKLSCLSLNSRNLYDYNNIIKGVRLNDNGLSIEDNNTFITDYIPVKANKCYKVGIYEGNKINYRICLYNTNKEFLSMVIPTNTKTEIEILTNHDGFMRCGFAMEDIKKVYICDKDKYEGYYETSYSLSDNILIPQNDTNLIKIGKNLFNKDVIEKAKILGESGKTFDNKSYNVSDYIKIEKGETYTLNKPRNYCIYNLKKRVVEYVESDSNFTTKTFTSKIDGYLRVSINTSCLDVMQIEKSSTETAYEKFYVEVPYLKCDINSNNPLIGKTLLNFGDSIACGTRSDPSYATLIAQNNFMTLFNQAVGGATVREIDGNSNNIINQIRNFTTTLTVDYILLNGLTNDVNAISGRPSELMGEMLPFNRDYNSSYNTKTFAGGLEEIFKLLTSKYPQAKIIFVCTHRMHTRSYSYQEEVQALARKICNKWSIPFVDIFNEGGYNSCIASLKTIYGAENGTDGTHINKLGYETFYVPRIENKMRSI